MLNLASSLRLSISHSNINPCNWRPETQSRAIAAIKVMGITAVALLAIANIPCASAEKMDDNTYNDVAAFQTVLQSGTGKALERVGAGLVFGQREADAYMAAQKSQEEGNGIIISVFNGLVASALSNPYRDCLDNARGFLDRLFCEIINPRNL